MPAKRGKEYFTISVVSSMFDIHPQTLRLYEREGLLRPERSAGNTRLYSRQDIEHLSTILNLTREMGVNLAGVSLRPWQARYIALGEGVAQRGQAVGRQSTKKRRS